MKTQEKRNGNVNTKRSKAIAMYVGCVLSVFILLAVARYRRRSGGVGIFATSLLFCTVNLMAYILFCVVSLLYMVRVHIRKGVDDYCWFIGFSTICIFFSQFWWNIWFLLPSTNTHRILRLQMTLKMCLSVCFFDAVCVPESMMIKLSRHTI